MVENAIDIIRHLWYHTPVNENYGTSIQETL